MIRRNQASLHSETRKTYIPVVHALLLAALACIGAGCRDPAADDPEIVAIYQGGTISRSDVDQAVLALPPGQRFPKDINQAEWYGSIVRQLAVDRLLLAAAKQNDFQQRRQFESAERAIRRTLYSEKYIADRAVNLSIADADIRRFYQENKDDYQQNARRFVYHIFKRFRTDASEDQVVAEANAIRERVLQGENFGLMARQFSDSESRHRDGALGFHEPGNMSGDFDQLIFSLTADVPSQPVKTNDGVHLFMVNQIVEARLIELAEVRNQIRQKLIAEYRQQTVAEIAAEMPVPEGSFLPGSEEIAELLMVWDPETILLKVGDFELNQALFTQRLMEQRLILGSAAPANLGLLLVDDIKNRELVYQNLLTQGGNQDPATESRITEALRRELIKAYAGNEITERLQADDERLQAHYQDNRMRFSIPPRVRLRRLALPLGVDAVEKMAYLEVAKLKLDTEQTDLQQIAAEQGVELQDTAWLTAAELQKIDLRSVRFAFFLEPGEHSPPYRSDDDHLVIFRVLERQEPVPIEFAAARDRVIQDYASHYAQKLFQEISTELLEQANFKIFAERLTDFQPFALPQKDGT